MAGKQRFEMSSTGSDVSNFPSTGTPLNVEDPFSELFWKQIRQFFQNDQALFEDLVTALPLMTAAINIFKDSILENYVAILVFSSGFLFEVMSLKHIVWLMQKREIEDEPAILTTVTSRTGEVKHTWSKLPVAWNLFSAFIPEGDSQESNGEMSDGPRDVFFDCTQIESDTENAGKAELEIEPEEYRGLDERGQKNQGEWESDFQTWGLVSSVAVNDTPYQEMNLDKRILLELESIGLYNETVPDPAWNEDEEIKLEMCKCKDELQHEVTKNRHHFDKVGNAVGKSQKVGERECEVIAMNIVESASNRHIGGAGVRRVSSQKQAFWPMLSGPQIRSLGQLKIQPQAELDGFLHTGTSSIATAKVRGSRSTRIRRRTVWGSATGSISRRVGV